MLNIPRQSKSIIYDIVYSNISAIDSGATSAVFSHGTKSHVCDIQGIKSDKEFINALEDNVHFHGAPSKMISDCGSVEISECIKNFLCPLCIPT